MINAIGVVEVLNHIVVMGRLTKEPELRTTSAGTSVASFTVAVARDFGAQKETDFIDCVVWRQTAEFISKHFHKGSMIVVSGRMQSRKWQTAEGENRTSWEVVAENAYFGESKRESNSDDKRFLVTTAGPDPNSNDPWSRFQEVHDDDLPF